MRFPFESVGEISGPFRSGGEITLVVEEEIPWKFGSNSIEVSKSPQIRPEIDATPFIAFPLRLRDLAQRAAVSLQEAQRPRHLFESITDTMSFASELIVCFLDARIDARLDKLQEVTKFAVAPLQKVALFVVPYFRINPLYVAHSNGLSTPWRFPKAKLTADGKLARSDGQPAQIVDVFQDGKTVKMREPVAQDWDDWDDTDWMVDLRSKVTICKELCLLFADLIEEVIASKSQPCPTLEPVCPSVVDQQADASFSSALTSVLDQIFEYLRAITHQSIMEPPTFEALQNEDKRLRRRELLADFRRLDQSRLDSIESRVLCSSRQEFPMIGGRCLESWHRVGWVFANSFVETFVTDEWTSDLSGSELLWVERWPNASELRVRVKTEWNEYAESLTAVPETTSVPNAIEGASSALSADSEQTGIAIIDVTDMLSDGYDGPAKEARKSFQNSKFGKSLIPIGSEGRGVKLYPFNDLIRAFEKYLQFSFSEQQLRTLSCKIRRPRKADSTHDHLSHHLSRKP